MRRTITLAAAALVLALGLAACGEKHDTITPTAALEQPFDVMLDATPSADHVGLYEAIANGDFAQAGLNVHVEVPSDPAGPLAQLAAGKVNVAISSVPELMLARDQGATLASIATVVQRPLTAIVSLGDKHITTPRQLRGKTVGDTGIGYENAFLQTILTQAGVPAGSVKEVDVGTNLVGAMLSGRVDATLGADWNDEAIQLAQDGRHTNVIHVEDAGVPTYDELVVVTTETEIANHNNELRRFIQALGRGYEAARADPQAAVANLVRANPGLDAKLALASAEATMSSFFPPNANANLPWGWQNGAQWTTFGEWMLHHHLISNPAAIPNTSTNQLLAGQGP